MLQQIGLDSARGFCSVSLFRSFCSWHTPLVRLCLTLPVLVATYWRLVATRKRVGLLGFPERGSNRGGSAFVGFLRGGWGGWLGWERFTQSPHKQTSVGGGSRLPA